MNILFLTPPADIAGKTVVCDRVYGCNYGYDDKPPIHSLSAATFLESRGKKVRVLDCPAEGISARKFLGGSEVGRPQLLVFFTTWLSAEIDIRAAKKVSEKLKNIKVAFMGSYPTWKPELFLINQDCFVVRGETEETLADLVRFIESSQGSLQDIRGLSYLKNNAVFHNPPRELLDIDALPMPDRRLLRGRYFLNRLQAYPATVACFSRGCSYRCAYCAPHALDQAIEMECCRHGLPKPRLRLRSAENVIKEFVALHRDGIKGVEVCDNQFVWDRERTLQICAAIKSLRLEWICYGRPDHLKDGKMLRSMAEAGCRLIYMGTESFDQKILDDLHKECAVSDYFAAVKAVREAGIEPEVSVLLGASGLETEASALASIRQARRLRTRFVHYSIALPLPHTPLYKNAKEKGWLKSREFVPVDNVRLGILDLPFLKAETLKKLVKRCYLRQYLSPGFVLLELGQLRSWGAFRRRLRSFKKFLLFLADRGPS